MEMIDVLKKLQEIAETKPELVKDAVESVEKTNPKEVKENAVESETPVKEYKVGSYKDFLKTKGINIYNLKGDEHVKWAKEYRAAKDQGGEAEYKKSGSRDHKTYTPSTKDEPAKIEADEPEAPEPSAGAPDPNTGGLKARQPGGMSDVHIGAQEVVDEFLDEPEGDLKMPKAQVLQAMKAEAEKTPFPRSYEIETAMQMVGEKFNDDGSRKNEMEPDMASAEPQTTETPVQEGPQQDVRKVMQTLEGLRDMVMELPISDDAKTSAHTALDQVAEDIMMDMDTESTELNTNTMKTEGKKPVNEAKVTEGPFGMGAGAGIGAALGGPVGAAIGALGGDALTGSKNKKDKKMIKKEEITMTADSPEEAGMLMQILKMAGVKPVDASMIGAEPEAGENPEHGEPGHVCGADETEGDEMAKYRDVVTAPDEEKAEENFANSEKEVERDLPKTSDVDTLVNVHSGGLNRQKQQVRKEYPGDNPLAVEDKITEEELANSLRAQYDGFKKAYQEAAKPDYVDLDKDGNKKETMKKAAKDKEAK